MSGSPGDRAGTVYLAHAWVDDEDRQHTTGPWHWWHVYKNVDTAAQQALRRARDWGEYGHWEAFAASAEELRSLDSGRRRS